jgi:hypothetical protein
MRRSFSVFDLKKKEARRSTDANNKSFRKKKEANLFFPFQQPSKRSEREREKRLKSLQQSQTIIAPPSGGGGASYAVDFTSSFDL